jgi:hypothetical protein
MHAALKSIIEEEIGARPEEEAGRPDEEVPSQPYLDENVQFTVYRPGTVEPGKWYPLLAFAHLSEIRPGEDEMHPLEQVERVAEQRLGEHVKGFGKVTQDSRQSVPREGELTFVPEIAGIEFNPASRTFLWLESVHHEEFRLRATSAMDGRMARGQMTVYLGSILLAEIPMSIRVDSAYRSVPEATPKERDQARPYRKIFASYSHDDEAIVKQVTSYMRGIGDTYLRDVEDLRSGEVWSERLASMIEEADVFQLFWSWNSKGSEFVEQEWRHAVSLPRTHFVRPTYWEDDPPLPPREPLPKDLDRLHFQRIPAGPEPAPSTAARKGESLVRSEGHLTQALAMEAVQRGDWDEAVFQLGALRDQVGDEVSPEIPRNLAFALANRAARDAESGVTLVNATLTRKSDRSVQPVRQGVSLLRGAQRDLQQAREIDPGLANVDELLRRVDAALRGASEALTGIRRSDLGHKPMSGRPPAPESSFRMAPASRGTIVIRWGFILIALATASLLLGFPAPVRIGAAIITSLLVVYALQGKGSRAVPWGLALMALAVVAFVGFPTPLRVGAIALGALTVVFYGLRHPRS